jgi:hypothetical protein
LNKNIDRKMNFDDDDDFDINDFNFEDDDPEGTKREMDEEDKRVRNMPLMQKANEIFDLTHAICESMPDDNEFTGMYRGLLMENAMMLAPKIAGAESIQDYGLKMENAVIIKVNAMQLRTQLNGCEMFDLVKEDYLEILREAIDEFKILFAEWVKKFEKYDIYDDGWGLWV